MKFGAYSGLIVLTCVFAFAGCGDDDTSDPAAAAGQGAAAGAGQAGEAHGHGGAAAEAALECQVIGELCHEADTGSGPAHDCHEVGHEGHVDACAKEFAGCIAICVPDDEPAGGASGSNQAAKCAALGELCHPVDDDNGPLHECHELGHVNDAAQCAAEFDSCAAQCLAAREELEANEGSGGASHGGAGGAGAAAVGGAAVGGAGGAK